MDTFSAAVAREAVAAGAHLVNDVSGGSLDPDMHATVSSHRFADCSDFLHCWQAALCDSMLQHVVAPHRGCPAVPRVQLTSCKVTLLSHGVQACGCLHSSKAVLLPLQVAELSVPYVLMHMRGNPTTMQQKHHITYSNVCNEVGQELQAAAEHAQEAGIEPWRIILDPGGMLSAYLGSVVVFAAVADCNLSVHPCRHWICQRHAGQPAPHDWPPAGPELSKRGCG